MNHDFDIQLIPLAGRQYRVQVTDSPAGRVSEVYELPADVALADWPSFGAHLRDVTVLGTPSRVSSRQLRLEGNHLFRLLFPGRVGERYQLSLERTDKPLRIRLHTSVGSNGRPSLDHVPWECLRDPEDKERFATSTEVALIRTLDVFETPRPGPTDPLRTLVAVASPADLEPVDVCTEIAAIERHLGESRVEVLGRGEAGRGTTFRQLYETLETGDHGILHVAAHGDVIGDEGILMLSDADGGGLPERVTADQLADLVRRAPHLQLVVLNACWGGAVDHAATAFDAMAPALLRVGIPAVLAMQRPISDGAAIRFADALYRALAGGAELTVATNRAREEIWVGDRNGGEHIVPVLYMHSDVRRLFGPDAPPTGRAIPEPPTTERSGSDGSALTTGLRPEVEIPGNRAATGSTARVRTFLQAHPIAITFVLALLAICVSIGWTATRSSERPPSQDSLMVERSEIVPSSTANPQHPDSTRSPSEEMLAYWQPMLELLDRPPEQMNPDVLRRAVHGWLRKRHTVIPYRDPGNVDSVHVLTLAQANPERPGEIIDLWKNESFPIHDDLREAGYSREHLWSRDVGVGDKGTAFADLHALALVDAAYNREMVDQRFDTCSGCKPLPTVTNLGIGGGPEDVNKVSYGDRPTEGIFEVWPARRGDVARALFYMAVRYEGDANEPDLRLVDPFQDFGPSTDGGRYGNLSTLMDWHCEDPPDLWEQRRNNVIAEHQHNRNPFIDYPEWPQIIWGFSCPP